MLGSYLAAQEGLRETAILTLDVSPEQETELAGVLQVRDPLTPVGLIQASRVNVTERALESADILPNEPGPVTVGRGGTLLQAGAPDSTTPGGLRQQIQNAGLVTARQTTGKPPNVSSLTSLINGLKEMFSRE